MTMTEKARAYHAALWQASAALEIGDVDAARRAIDSALQDDEYRMMVDFFTVATDRGDQKLLRWRYRAEQASRHFIIHQRHPGIAGEDGPFVVTHDPTGLYVAIYRTRSECRQLVRLLEARGSPALSARTMLEIRERLSDTERRAWREMVEQARIHPVALTQTELAA
jgi:hypothetical protein